MYLVGNKRSDIARVIPCENNFCTKYAHHLHFCGLQKLNTLNLRHFHPPLNTRNHFSTVLIKTNWNTISCKYDGCENLEQVVSFIKMIFNLNTNVFSDKTYLNATLYIPEGRRKAYEAATGWQKFVYMEEGVPDGIEDIKSERNDAIEVARYNSDGIAINARASS